MAGNTVTWKDVQASYDTMLEGYVKANGGPPPSFRDMITDTQLAALRSGFDGADAMAAIQWSLGATYAPYAPSSEWVLRRFYVAEATDGPGGLSPAVRELIQLALLCADGNLLYIGIHVYWALCQDDTLDVDQVAQAVMLASVYLGVDAWSTGQSAMQGALQAMAKCADDGKTDYTSVVGALVAALDPSSAI